MTLLLLEVSRYGCFFDIIRLYLKIFWPVGSRKIRLLSFLEIISTTKWTHVQIVNLSAKTWMLSFFFLDLGTSPSNCDKLNKFSIINRIKKSIEPILDKSRKVEMYNGFYKNLKTNKLPFRDSLHIKSTKQSEIN